MFTRIGRTVAHHPVRVIVAWSSLILGLALVAAAVVGKSNPTSQQQTDFLPGKYESVQAAKLSAARFPQPGGARATLVVTRTDHHQMSTPDLAKVTALIRRLDTTTHLPKLVGVAAGSLVRAPNGSAAIATAQFSESSGNPDVISSIKKLRSHTTDVFRGSGYSTAYTGEAAQVADSGVVQKLIVFGTVLAIFLLLLVLFRSFVVAGGAVALMYLVGAVAQMVLAIAAHVGHFKIDETTTNLLPIVLFGVGTDYVVFFMFRYREHLRRGQDHREAIATAIGRVGEAVSSSALAVIVSFAALLLSQLKSLRLLGPALGLAVLLMLASSLTLIPAVLALSGRRLSRRASWRQPQQAGRAAAVGRFVAHRPAAALLAALVGFLALGSAALAMHADYRSPNPPSGTESGRAWHTVTQAFPAGALYPTEVYVHDRHGQPLSAATLTGVRQALARVPGIGEVAAPQTNKTGDTALLSVQLDVNPSSEQAVDIVRHGLVPLGQQLAAHDSGLQVEVGGPTMAQADFETALARDMRVIFPVAGLLIGLVLVLMLRAVVAPALLMVSVALGFIATLGASVIVFQGINGDLGLVGTLPMIVYLFVASIGTDYNIMMIARIRDELRAGRPVREAVAHALRQTGPTVAAAGVVLAASFAILMLSSYVAQIGFAVAAGVLISLFLSSWLYLPALTTLLGNRMWWPGRDHRPTGYAEVAASTRALQPASR
jgi:RND superfamily putative drug exporter